LHFYEDENFKKTLETMRLIDQATSEIKENTEEQMDENKV
jgi:hypothetical protein